jgi:hypothetical protein
VSTFFKKKKKKKKANGGERNSIKLEIESKVEEKFGLCWIYVVIASHLIYI